LSQGGEGAAGSNVVDLARSYLGRAAAGVLHRIDRNVSGIVLVSKHATAARAMSGLFQRAAVVRVYQAVVRGSPPEGSFAMNAALAKDERRNQVRAATPAMLADMDETARAAFAPARTEARVVRRFQAPLGRCAVLEVRPITGRSHQIRVHLADAGLPIIGDPKYGVLAKHLNRPLLHAAKLEFIHPRTSERVLLAAPLPWNATSLAKLVAANAPRASHNRSSASDREPAPRKNRSSVTDRERASRKNRSSVSVRERVPGKAAKSKSRR
jgi:23S rRNA pseudouridine1911/1915/1917 synthase